MHSRQLTICNVKIAAGENHLAMLSNEGDVLTFGEGSMGQLGRSPRTEHIRPRKNFIAFDLIKHHNLRVHG